MQAGRASVRLNETLKHWPQPLEGRGRNRAVMVDGIKAELRSEDTNWVQLAQVSGSKKRGKMFLLVDELSALQEIPISTELLISDDRTGNLNLAALPVLCQRHGETT
jgi:hypothetical protein